MPEKGELENIELERESDTGDLVLRINMQHRLRRTGKNEDGKSMIIATTNGFHMLESGEWISLMVGNKE